MKTPDQVADQVKAEIAARPSFSNPPGLDFSSCLVPPRLVPVKKGIKMDTPGEMWLVLEEDPFNHQGYRILYDETQNQYGLGFMAQGEDILLFLGYYGNFMDTVEGM